MGNRASGVVRLSDRTTRLIRALNTLLWAGGLSLVLQGCADTPVAHSPADSPRAGHSPASRIDSSATPGSYVVQRGDTLSSIARRHKVSVHSLVQANHLSNRDHIEVGQRLHIPSSSSSTAANPKKSSHSRARPVASSIPPAVVRDTTPLPRGVLWRWPADGVVLQRYNPALGIKGIEIGGRLGAPVRSAAAGKVVYAGKGVTGYPGLVIIKHNTDYMSAYANNSEIRVRMGEEVAAGQTIAGMGQGRDGKPALHFEIRLRGKAVDPLRLLPKRR